MAFVYEEITEETKKMFEEYDEQFKKFKLAVPIGNYPRSINISEVIADHGQNAFLIPLGGQGYYGGDIPAFFAFIWNDQKIDIEVFRKGERRSDGGVDYFVKITGIMAPRSLVEAKGEELVELVKGAVSVGVAWLAIKNRNRYEVHFDHVAKPGYYAGGKQK